MSKKQKEKMTLTQKEYQELAKSKEPPRPVFVNCLKAFLVGGVICLVGQCVQEMFVHWAGFSEEKASSPTVAVIIFISVVLTCLGLYDKIAQWAGAGTAVPVTGFANTMASAAIEHRSEGFVLGVGGKMFKIAGPVIVFGTVAAFIIGILHWIFNPAAVGG